MQAGVKKKMRILILSAPVGSGHKMAAGALAEAFSALPATQVTQGDVFTFFPALLGNGFLAAYKTILRFCPFLYAFSYRWSNAGSGSLCLRTLINRFILLWGKKYLDAVAPDVILSTHGTPTGIVSLYKKKYAPQLWLGVIVTDYTVHRWLVYPETDVYFTATQDLQEELRKLLPIRGGEGPVSKAFGIPLRQRLRPLCNEAGRITARQKTARRFDWSEDAFICLLSGGGEGLLPMEEIIPLLVKALPADLHIIAVTGHNVSLKTRLEKSSYATLSRLKILGFTEALPELMAAADIMVGKGGGISIAECLALGTPLLIYAPLPGQEEKNAAFVRRHEGGKTVFRIEEIVPAVQAEINKNPAVRVKERENLRHRLGHPEAAVKIAGFTKNLRI